MGRLEACAFPFTAATPAPSVKLEPRRRSLLGGLNADCSLSPAVLVASTAISPAASSKLDERRSLCGRETSSAGAEMRLQLLADQCEATEKPAVASVFGESPSAVASFAPIAETVGSEGPGGEGGAGCGKYGVDEAGGDGGGDPGVGSMDGVDRAAMAARADALLCCGGVGVLGPD